MKSNKLLENALTVAVVAIAAMIFLHEQAITVYYAILAKVNAPSNVGIDTLAALLIGVFLLLTKIRQ